MFHWSFIQTIFRWMVLLLCSVFFAIIATLNGLEMVFAVGKFPELLRIFFFLSSREGEGEREHFGKRSISVSVLAAQYNVGGGLGRGWRGCKSASDSASSVILFIFSSPPSSPIISAGCLWSAPAPCSSPSSPSTNRPVLSALLVVSYPFYSFSNIHSPFFFTVSLSICRSVSKSNNKYKFPTIAFIVKRQIYT